MSQPRASAILFAGAPRPYSHAMPGRLEVVASERHYYQHLLPLARGVSGAVFCTHADPIAERARIDDLDPHRPPIHSEGPPVLVAAYRDATRVPPERKLALLEHGAGQGYEELKWHPGYSGGESWARASLFLVPGPHAGRRWRAAYPDTPVIELGGTPRLDGLPAGPRMTSDQPVIAFSFHWACTLVQEANSTWNEWMPAIRDLARDGRYRLIGHGHPRAWDRLAPLWRRLDILPVPDFTEVLERADLYVCDNSSTMYEFAGTDRPVLTLNASTYRRDVEHGLRFWSHIPGLACDYPEDLPRMVGEALEDGPVAQELRARAVEEVYGGFFDGRATARAVAALEHWISE